MQRLMGDRIENRVDIGTVKRLYLYKNGDPHFKPKMFVYRSKIHKKWEKFLDEVEKVAPPIRGGNVRHLYTVDGGEVKSFDELRDYKSYIVAGSDGFLDIKGGYPLLGLGAYRTGPLEEVFRKENTATPARPKSRMRPFGQRLHDRQLPEPTFFFVFKNGDGLEAKRFLFTPQQMDKGMPWMLEQIARRFNIYARKLVTMDNRQISDVQQIKNRGAYIIIPFGESFTDNWYYLPDMAVDTSAPGARPDRVLQNRQRSQSRANTARSRSNYGYRNTRSHYNDGYDSRTESARGTNSDDERYNENQTRPKTTSKTRHRNPHMHRSESAASHCSFCEMLERHRSKHHFYSDDENGDEMETRLASRRSARRTSTNDGYRPESTQKALSKEGSGNDLQPDGYYQQGVQKANKVLLPQPDAYNTELTDEQIPMTTTKLPSIARANSDGRVNMINNTNNQSFL